MLNFAYRTGSIRNLGYFLIESALIFASVYLSVALRFRFDADLILHYDNLFSKAVLITFVYQLSLYYHDLFFSQISRFKGNLFLKLGQAIAVGFLTLSIIFYIFPGVETGRGILLIEMVLLLGVFFALRVVYLQGARSEDFGDKVVIMGIGRLARQIGQALHQRPEHGYKILGFIDDKIENVGMSVVNPGVIGIFDDLLDIVRKNNVQAVISALPEQRGKLPVDALLQCKLLGVKVLDGISFYERLRGKIALDELKPSWVIFSSGFHAPKLTLLIKRTMDIAFSLAGVVVAFPLFLLISLFIKLDSRGPVFYSQTRVGESGKIFSTLKFRSMREDAESGTGPVWARKNDDRVTRMGRVLRKMRLDELPQLINIIRGDMSLVGPRPERPEFVEQLRKENPYYTLRLTVKPGLTGWAQINYRYGATSKDAMEKLQYDLYYIKNMSGLFDLYILFQTIKIVLVGNGAR